MDETENAQYLEMINARLGELNRNLKTIMSLLALIAIFTFITGRAAVIEHGIWTLLGF